jgi:hypothetical protein
MDRTHRLTKQSAICEICGLTVPNKEELEDHVNHAHKEEGRELQGRRKE